jgi:hypothetical protein
MSKAKTDLIQLLIRRNPAATDVASVVGTLYDLGVFDDTMARKSVIVDTWCQRLVNSTEPQHLIQMDLEIEHGVTRSGINHLMSRVTVRGPDIPR